MWEEIKILINGRKIKVIFLIWIIILSLFIYLMNLGLIYNYAFLNVFIVMCIFILTSSLIFNMEKNHHDQQLKYVNSWKFFLFKNKYKEAVKLLRNYREFEIKSIFYFISGFFAVFYFFNKEKNNLSFEEYIKITIENDSMMFMTYIYVVFFLFIKTKQNSLRYFINKMEKHKSINKKNKENYWKY